MWKDENSTNPIRNALFRLHKEWEQLVLRRKSRHIVKPPEPSARSPQREIEDVVEYVELF